MDAVDEVLRMLQGADDEGLSTGSLAQALRGLTPEQMVAKAEEREAQARQRGLGSLGLLTGDRVLAGFGRSQIEQAAQERTASQKDQPGLLRLATLAQGAERLAMQKAAEDRRAGFQGKAFDATQKNNEERLRLARLGLDIQNQGMQLQAKSLEERLVNQSQQQETGLREEFNRLPEVKAYAIADATFKRLESALADPSGAGDLAGIFGFMKLLDPSASVMEGDVANAQNAGGIPDRIRTLYNKALAGERLSSDQREDFLRVAKGQLDVYRSTYDATARRYADIARQTGAVPERVAIPGGHLDLTQPVVEPDAATQQRLLAPEPVAPVRPRPGGKAPAVLPREPSISKSSADSNGNVTASKDEVEYPDWKRSGESVLQAFQRNIGDAEAELPRVQVVFEGSDGSLGRTLETNVVTTLVSPKTGNPVGVVQKLPSGKILWTVRVGRWKDK